MAIGPFNSTRWIKNVNRSGVIYDPTKLSTPHGGLKTKKNQKVDPQPTPLSTPHGGLKTSTLHHLQNTYLHAFNSTRWIKNFLHYIHFS